MSVSFYLYVGIAIEAVALVWLVIIASRVRTDRSMAAGMPLKMEEIKSQYRRQRWKVLLLQLSGLGIMLLGTVIGQ